MAGQDQGCQSPGVSESGETKAFDGLSCPVLPCFQACQQENCTQRPPSPVSFQSSKFPVSCAEPKAGILRLFPCLFA